ncbi:MAG: manganese catalase family protein [Clostridiales bacterium]|nr:manganese catalase family protein [Clostridiales bacterium]
MSHFPQFIPMLPTRAAARPRPGIPVCVDTAPYPEVTGKPDSETVAMLKEDYAGAGSELTAVTQYVFQTSRCEDEAYANAILQIAIVEMLHLDMLGDAIVTLGGNPSFDDGHYYWSAHNVNYAVNQADMLRANIEAEKGAIAAYERHAAATTNETVKALLHRIITDELLHLRFFEESLAALR